MTPEQLNDLLANAKRVCPDCGCDLIIHDGIRGYNPNAPLSGPVCCARGILGDDPCGWHGDATDLVPDKPIATLVAYAFELQGALAKHQAAQAAFALTQPGVHASAQPSPLPPRCPSCREHHHPQHLCPPHETRTTGTDYYRQEIATLDAEIVRLTNQSDDQRATLAICLEAITDLQAALPQGIDAGWNLPDILNDIRQLLGTTPQEDDHAR